MGSVLSETDLALINALQVAPRAGWLDVGRALGVSAATAARRWEALHADGVAWVTCAIGPRYAGAAMLVSLAAAPGQYESLAKRLCDEPAAATVSMVTGPNTFLVDCFAPDPEQLKRVAMGTFSTMPEVAHVESTFCVASHRTGADYRSGALEPSQERMIGDAAEAATRSSGRVDHVDRMLIRELTRDGRASWAELAELCSVSPQTARRRVGALTASGHIALRCECSVPARGPLYEVNLQIAVPEGVFDAAAAYFARLRECRLCIEVVGAHNLAVALWVRSLHEIRTHEHELEVRAPGCRILGRDLTLRTVKRLGHVLDETGRSIRTVPPQM